jgi:hypothetical protein
VTVHPIYVPYRYAVRVRVVIWSQAPSDGGPPTAGQPSDPGPERQRSTEDCGEDGRSASIDLGQFDVVDLADSLAIDVDNLPVEQHFRQGEPVSRVHVIALPW